MISSVNPPARYASVVSGERLSKYSTATLLGGTPGLRPGSARATGQGGGEPSGHWADSRMVGLTDSKNPKGSPHPTIRLSDHPTLLIAAATPRRAAGTGGPRAVDRTPVPAGRTRTAPLSAARPPGR